MYPCYLLHEIKRLGSSKQSRFSIKQLTFGHIYKKLMRIKIHLERMKIVEIIRGIKRTKLRIKN